MSSSAIKNRQDRSSTVSNAPDYQDKKHRQPRHAISHRPHASHTFALHRNARDGAHQLGADLKAGFLTSRSTGPSTTHSNNASRHPSGDESIQAEPSSSKPLQRDENAGGKLSTVKPSVTWDDVRELRRLRQELYQRLRQELETLSDMALSGSRQADSTLLKIQGDIQGAAFDVGVLRELAHSSHDTLSRFTHETIPSVTRENERQITTLQNTYDKMEQTQIGGLETRLDNARRDVQALKERMQHVRNDVGDWEIKDREELKRSQRRHWVFWVVAILILALFAVALLPRPEQRHSYKTVPAVNLTDTASFVEATGTSHVSTNDRLKPPARQEEEDERFKVFDEL